MRTILVTGAAGFIGSHLSATLQRLPNTRVVGVDNFCNYYDPALKHANADWLRAIGVEMLSKELTQLHEADLPTDVEYVLHAAAQPGISSTTSFDAYVHNNVMATARLLDYARRLPQLRLLVYLSTSSVYGSPADVLEEAVPAPISAYGVTKLAAEQHVLSLARSSGFPACACRLFSVYGPRERPDKLVPKLMRSVFSGEPFPLHEGSLAHLRSYTFVDDIVEGMLAAMNSTEGARGRIYNIGSERVHCTGDVIKAVERVSGRKLNHTLLPPRAGDQQTTKARIDRARTDFQYAPRTTLEQGIQQTYDWAKQESQNQSAWASALGSTGR